MSRAKLASAASKRAGSSEHPTGQLRANPVVDHLSVATGYSNRSGCDQRRARTRTAVPEPQQRKSEQRDEDIGPEDDAGIARCEVMRGHDLIEMADRRPQREDAERETIVVPSQTDQGRRVKDQGCAIRRGSPA